MAARKTTEAKDPTAAKPKGDSYSVYDAAGKKVVGGVGREVAVREYDQVKREQGQAPQLVRESDKHSS